MANISENGKQSDATINWHNPIELQSVISRKGEAVPILGPSNTMSRDIP